MFCNLGSTNNFKNFHLFVPPLRGRKLLFKFFQKIYFSYLGKVKRFQNCMCTRLKCKQYLPWIGLGLRNKGGLKTPFTISLIYLPKHFWKLPYWMAVDKWDDDAEWWPIRFQSGTDFFAVVNQAFLGNTSNRSLIPLISCQTPAQTGASDHIFHWRKKNCIW